MSADVIDISGRFRAQCHAEVYPLFASLRTPDVSAAMEAAGEADKRAQAALEGVKRRARDARGEDYAAEIIACSDCLDSVIPVLERIARALGKPALIRTAQDIDALSERLVHHAAEIQDEVS